MRRYATFDGRADRPEHWWFALAHLVVVSLPQWLGWATLLAAVVLGGDGGRALALLGACLLAVGAGLGAVLLVPGSAVAVRRLHDTGRSGLWLLLVLAPYAWPVLVWLLAEDGRPGPNRFGPDPKGRVAVPTAPTPAHRLVLPVAAPRLAGPALLARRWLQPR